VLDEGQPSIVDATIDVVDQVAMSLGTADDPTLVADWLEHRNDTSALQALSRKGYVVDTMEIAAPWSQLHAVYDATTRAILGVPHARVASCHLSHSYLDGACLYFTFAATPPPDEIEQTYVACWATTTAWVSTGRDSRPRRSARGSACCRRSSARSTRTGS
jgi:alkyldihydroxyacetonephosphate synthase